MSLAVDRLMERGRSKDWWCEVQRRIVRYVPDQCRLWLPNRNVAAPGHELCGPR